MTPTTFLPNFAMGFFERMTSALTAGNLDEWPAEEMWEATVFCRQVRLLGQGAQKAVERKLAQGVDSKWLVVHFDPLLERLERFVADTKRLVADSRARPVPEHVDSFLREIQGLGDDMADLEKFLVPLLAKAKAAPRPIDWKRVEAAEAAYARGETRPFRRSKANAED